MENNKKPIYWIFIKSFTDMHAYRHFASKNLLKPFLYILILTLLLAVVFSSIYIASVNSYTTELITQLKQNSQKFSIKNAELVIDNDQPIILAETADKGTLIIIDKEYAGSVTKYEEYDTVIVLGKKDVYLSNAAIRYLVSYESILGLQQEVTSEMLIETISSAKSFLYVFLFLMLFIFFFINYLLYTLLISLVVNIIRRTRKKNTNLMLSLQLSAYALTLPSIIYVIWMFITLNVVLGDLLIFILALIIAYKGIDSFYKHMEEDLNNPDKKA
ncbi:MAG: DUF1189 family protein [Clostridia bacterium]|jgi:hypothetical protein|nr:DUF1189 family protein [Clostridia bacterium]MDD4502975.1 DUF1189 family protein [Clostridia bacterium]NLV33483.1 DUF1189 family protein [Clostridiaceae bacterium]HPB16467.1 DUF1189 family protein [Clostridia bacterium]